MKSFALTLAPSTHALVRVGIALLVGLCALGAKANGTSVSKTPGSSTNSENDMQVLLQAVRAAAKSGTNAVRPSVSANASAKGGRIDNMDALDDYYKMMIGDRVSFRIVEDEDDPKELMVNASGDLEIPYIGLYAATGKTCRELARALKVELEKEYYYKATVIVAVEEWAKNQGKVYLVGAVRAPGPEDIPSDEVLTLSKAILRAGGFTDYADEHKVRVTRKSAVPGGKDEEFFVDVEDVLQKADRAADRTLVDGDLIYVPEKLVHF
jgi:protein involved in polysaccharide export with SLBB domain